MRLYHFTARTHLPMILTSGYLKVVESNLSATREHAGPDVVWLTSNPTALAQGWQLGSSADKTAVRFTVDVPDRQVHRWLEWAGARGIDPAWLAALASSGGSDSWYVVERAIPASEWIEVIESASGLPMAR